jgi:hypothetical protein
MRIACLNHGNPYIIPVNFGYLNGYLYFHSSQTGQKMGCLQHNPQIAFQVDTNVEIIPFEQPCKNTVHYQSVTGSGMVAMIDEPAEKRLGLLCLARQIGNRSDEMDQHAVDQAVVLRIEITSCTFKQSPI